MGDYYLDTDFHDIMRFKVSEMNADYEFLVLMHEMVEWYLTQKRGITEHDITAFDIEFERERAQGNVDEPGDHPEAPYRREHRFAENIERLIAAELGVDWAIYNKTVEGL